MITGDRRSHRRGMIVLGKLPSVPRPINLPSQRLENRGLDPNVEIVPRGTVTWGNTSRSPPTGNSNWGTGSQPSSPPVNAGAWGANKPASTAWGPNSTRPSSAGSTRPTSAGGSSSSGGSRPADLARPSSAGNQDVPPQNAWGSAGSRPSTASGAQVTSQPPGSRPRSAESSRPNGRVSVLGSELTHAGAPPPQPWGPPPRKLPEDQSQSSRFTLTTGDFPTLGSEKNPNLRPQQRDRSDHPDDRSDDRPPTAYSDSYQYEDGHPPGSRFNEGGDGANVWARGPGPFRGPPNMEGGPGYGMPTNSWRREPPHEHPEGDEHWPPNGPGPYPGPPRFPNPEFLPQRFGPGPGSYGRGGPDGYPPPQFMRPMNPERPPQFGPGMFPGPGPYEGYYGYPGYNVDEREMMMWGGPGYGGFHPDFPRHPMGPRPRHIPNNHPGFGKDGEAFHSEFRPGGVKAKEGGEGHPEFRREPPPLTSKNEPPKRALHTRPHGQRDWGNDEPMDFSRPVFEKDTPPAKNHKVSFKAEPTVADVAILKKPQPVAKEEEAPGDGSRAEEGVKAEGLSPKESGKEVAEEKVAPEATTAAGVLGKAPVQPAVEEASPRGIRSSGDGSRSDHQGLKSKSKLSSSSAHEAEKEWRPKVHLMEAKGQDESENGGDVYDYEAQRARLKELAAQRARQLQKEEEERIKDQKAKANAKLEELNRRSGTVSTTSTETPSPVVQDDRSEVVQKLEADQIIPETQFGTYRPSDLQQELRASGSQTKRPVRKANRSREERARVQQHKEDVSLQNPFPAEEETQTLPSAASHTPDEPQDGQQQAQPIPQKQSRPRGGQRGKQHGKQTPKADAGKGETSAEQQQVIESRPADAAVESDSPAAGEPSGNGPSSTGNRRRKVGRNPRNRQRNEGGGAPTPALEKSSSGEIQEHHHQPVESSKGPEISSHSEGGESTTVEAPGGELLPPDERGSSRGRKFPRRFPGARRPSSSGSKPQDVRVSDKGGEGMRWAPVRNNSRSEISPDSAGEKQHKNSINEGEAFSSPRQPKSRRAEMERYTPKPVKQQGSSQAPPGGSEESDKPQQRPGGDSSPASGQGSGETFHRPPGRAAWRQRPENPNPNPNPGHGSFRGPGTQQRENGMVYQQKSGRQFQDAGGGAEGARFHQYNHQGGGGHNNNSNNNNRGFPGSERGEYHQAPGQSKGQGGVGGDGGEVKEFRGRESSRRGRFGGGGGRGGGGPRSVVDVGARAGKQRMVIDATGGAVPNQVVG